LLHATSCFWFNAVEVFSTELAKLRLLCGVFHTLVDVDAIINRFVADNCVTPMPFSWTTDPD